MASVTGSDEEGKAGGLESGMALTHLHIASLRGPHSSAEFVALSHHPHSYLLYAPTPTLRKSTLSRPEREVGSKLKHGMFRPKDGQ
jgi:hypothetical protein